MTTRGLLDTSVFIASESGRPLRAELLPDEVAISVITVAELHAGVLVATDTETRARRLSTVASLDGVTALPIDEPVARAWAHLRVHLLETGRRVNVNDLWIAATAQAHRLPLVTHDADFTALADVPGMELIRV